MLRANTKDKGLNDELLQAVEGDEDLGPILKLHMMIQKVKGKNAQNGAHIKELDLMYKNLKGAIDSVARDQINGM